MAVKYPIMVNGMYTGGMSQEQIDLIMNIRGMDKVDGLKKMVFNFPPELCSRSVDENKSIRSILEEEGIDSTEYLGELRDEQTVGTAFMYASPRSIIGDGVGFGKTAEISALINFTKKNGELKRFLMAVETSALTQTQMELIKFTGLYIVTIPSEAPKMRKVIEKTDWNKVDGVVIKHGALRSDLFSRWLSLYIDEKGYSKIFDTFILDESSVIKNSGKKITEYTQNICNIMSRRVHFMNATTFETNIMEIYNQIDMMNPELLPKAWRIQKEFCTYTNKPYWTRDASGKAKMNNSRQLSGYKNQAIFKESLKLFYFGRERKHRPGNKYKVVLMDPTTDQMLAINKGFRYMEVLNSPANVPDANIPFTREDVPKLDKLVQMVSEEYQGKKVMVYCFHIIAQHKIAEELRKQGKIVDILNGTHTDIERVDKMRGFNTGETDVLVTNSKKSLNLHAGDVCIFYSMEPTPSKMEQIRGRIDRNVDDKDKEFVLLAYEHTDEYRFLTEVVSQRSKDARDLTIDSKTAIDFFMESMALGNADS